ncbi:MAG: insulinase family protein [Erysipelotrichaceae bacterium]|nr:insulinase family protein [Erysipelotrichaceae bacterium]
MNRIYNARFDETYFHEILDNGLEVIIFHKPGFVSSFAAVGTAYGALGIKERAGDRDYDFDPGTAHFLEHKLFESEDKNVFERFSELGCNVNAFTSYHETVYHFSTASADIRRPLTELLGLVQKLDITEESVEKEKGIIIQELSMYMQDADSRLLNETYASLYHNYPLRFDIGGDTESVMRISREELETCYRLNYHPSEMTMVIITPMDPEKVLECIKEDQKNKGYVQSQKPRKRPVYEPDEVCRKEYSFNMDISAPKHVYALKLKPDFRDKRDITYREWCLNFYLKACFSPLNSSYQKWLDEGLINDYFGYEVDLDDEYANILFFCEGDTDLKKLVDEELEKDLINEDILRQIKRRYIGSSFRNFNDISGFGTGYIRDHLNGYDFFEVTGIMEDIEVEDLKRVFAETDRSNYALIHVFPSGK